MMPSVVDLPNNPDQKTTAAPDSSESPGAAPSAILFAKPAVPGRCKTRLLSRYSPVTAARVHAAMTACLLDRLAEMPWTRGWRLVLAMDDGLADLANPASFGFKINPKWYLHKQGPGDLGARIIRVWTELGADTPALLLGCDAPDLPTPLLARAADLAVAGQIALGPAADGGYWTLAAARLYAGLFDRIDWGGPTVYHQTLSAALRLGLFTTALDPWEDVDVPQDLDRLLKRLQNSADPILGRLLGDLNTILKESP